MKLTICVVFLTDFCRSDQLVLGHSKEALYTVELEDP